jgi:hypothetical protein
MSLKWPGPEFGISLSSPFRGDMRRSSADLKELFLQAYRQFVSPAVRQQVSDIARENLANGIVP